MTSYCKDVQCCLLIIADDAWVCWMRRLQIQLLTSWAECVHKMRTVLVNTLKLTAAQLTKRWVRYVTPSWLFVILSFSHSVKLLLDQNLLLCSASRRHCHSSQPGSLHGDRGAQASGIWGRSPSEVQDPWFPGYGLKQKHAQNHAY